jgi:hypothetical protein
MKVRLIAFGCHLLLSIVIVTLSMTVVIGVWYPAPLFYVQDFSKILLTIISIDIVLGPLLTFIVYNPKKALIKVDLAIIFMIQVLALSYGVYTSFISRPIFVVYSNDRFSSVGANESERFDLKKIPAQSLYLTQSKMGPRWVGAVAPENLSIAEKMDLEFSTAIGDGLRMMPQYFVTYEKIKAMAMQMGTKASDLNLDEDQIIRQSSATSEKMRPRSRDQIIQMKIWLTHFNLPLERIILVPLKGRENFAIIALDANTGIVLDSLSQDPWWYQ